MQKINTKVLMSGADYFNDGFAINAYMDDQVPVHLERAIQEHTEIRECFEKAGIEVIKVDPPDSSQDGVYTANWALVKGNKAIMSNLPNKRESEEAYAEKILKDLGFETIKLPKELSFSGQGDALPCGDYLFTGSLYRTDPKAHQLLEKELGFNVVSLQTIPQLDSEGNSITNSVTGWPDSYFYDIDLALAVISPTLIAWCPESFMPSSQETVRAIDDIEKIEISLEEAMNGFACNLVSTGESVVMSNHAPNFQKELEQRGLKVYTPNVTELLKGGGFIRCTSLTIQN